MKDKSSQLRILKGLMNRPDVECVINACDAGREGELIGRLVYEHAKCTKKLYRLWISSMEESAIRDGFDKIIDGKEYDNLYAAASCRERADWAVGINATRAFSCAYGVTLNVGRVQSPTLAMIVKRDADIATFIKKPFFTPVIDCGMFTAFGDKSENKQETEAIRVACDGKPAAVRAVERQQKTVAPPKLFDLTSLQREANRLYGYTAQQTLDIAQSLYEKAILSYPRSDSRYLTKDMSDTAGGLIAWAQSDNAYHSGTKFEPNITRITNDEKVSDHHAIIPTPAIKNVDMNALSASERHILTLVIVRMLCAVAPPHRYEAVTANVDCGGYLFVAKGKTVLEDGWKSIETAFKASLKTKLEKDDDGDSATLPNLAEGRHLKK